ncbi:MAG: alpha/beta fold hydrolase [Anaerolineaceae bacterium]|nr:alpha/beta fold hydrolase [Anaerolineaceae bacterium]
MNAKPTIVFVHGAFAESSSWEGVISQLSGEGYPAAAAANPLRSVKVDAENLTSLLQSIDGPVILVGHSYGGMVISNAAYASDNVKALVYVAAFAPEIGESAADLSGRYPGSTLGPTLLPVKLADGGTDLYIQTDKFWQQFAADVPEAQAKIMAATQRPITQAALTEASSAAAWKTLPSWFIFGEADKNIPAAAQHFMAERAGSKNTIAIDGASHVVMISHPSRVAQLIEEAAMTVLELSPAN